MINAIQDMKDCIKHAYSEDFLKKNKLINKYMNKKYNINVYWSLNIWDKRLKEKLIRIARF